MLELLVPLLGCGLMMLVPMALMARVSNRNRSDEPVPPSEDIAALRDEVARLRQLDQPDRTATDANPTGP